MIRQRRPPQARPRSQAVECATRCDEASRTSWAAIGVACTRAVVVEATHHAEVKHIRIMKEKAAHVLRVAQEGRICRLKGVTAASDFSPAMVELPVQAVWRRCRQAERQAPQLPPPARSLRHDDCRRGHWVAPLASSHCRLLSTAGKRGATYRWCRRQGWTGCRRRALGPACRPTSPRQWVHPAAATSRQERGGRRCSRPRIRRCDSGSHDSGRCWQR